MKSALLASALLFVTFSAPGAGAADCRAIVANTLAELKAAYPDWDDGMDTLARTAAASACVKASSATAAAESPALIEERAVPAGEAETTATSTETAVAASASAAEATASAEAETGSAKEEGGSWNPFKDIKFNKVSASPNKKPYERRREVNNTGESEESEE